jgi:hypothetical protein
MSKPDYSYNNLIQIAEKAREEQRKKEEEAILNYRPSFWEPLLAAAMAGESSFKALISSSDDNIEMLYAFFKRNGFQYKLEPFFGIDKEGHTITISLISQKKEEVEEKDPPYDVIVKNLEVSDEIQFMNAGRVWSQEVIHVDGNRYQLNHDAIVYRDNAWILIDGLGAYYIKFTNRDSQRLYASFTGFQAALSSI